MSKYKITGERRYEEDYIIFPIENKVITNESVGDIIGVDCQENLLWVLSYGFDKDDDRTIQEFILEYFKDPIQVYNTIFKKTQF